MDAAIVPDVEISIGKTSSSAKLVFARLMTFQIEAALSQMCSFEARIEMT
jgi:hypothetical protein